MKIGDLALTTGISTSAIRFYEKNGLIPQAQRRNNGYRDYSQSAIDRLRTIAICKDLGFSLAEIKRALPEALDQQPETALKCDDIIAHLTTKLRTVEGHIADLTRLKEKLSVTLTHFETAKARGEHVTLTTLEQ